METFQNKDITTLDEILDQKYGERGTANREIWEQEFEGFLLGILLKEAKKKWMDELKCISHYLSSSLKSIEIISH